MATSKLFIFLALSLLDRVHSKLLSENIEIIDGLKCVIGMHQNMGMIANISMMGITTGCYFYETTVVDAEEASAMLVDNNFETAEWMSLREHTDCRGLRMFYTTVMVLSETHDEYEKRRARIAIRVVGDRLQIYFPPRINADLIKSATLDGQMIRINEVRYTRVPLQSFRSIFSEPVKQKTNQGYNCDLDNGEKSKCFERKPIISSYFQHEDHLFVMVRDVNYLYVYYLQIQMHEDFGAPTAKLVYTGHKMDMSIFPQFYDAQLNIYDRGGHIYAMISNKNDVGFAPNNFLLIDFELLFEGIFSTANSIQVLPNHLLPLKWTHEYAAVFNGTLALLRSASGCEAYFGYPTFVDFNWLGGVEFSSFSPSYSPLDSIYPRVAVPQVPQRKNKTGLIVYLIALGTFFLIACTHAAPYLIDRYILQRYCLKMDDFVDDTDEPSVPIVTSDKKKDYAKLTYPKPADDEKLQYPKKEANPKKTEKSDKE